jgi:hypothetical protein
LECKCEHPLKFWKVIIHDAQSWFLQSSSLGTIHIHTDTHISFTRTTKRHGWVVSTPTSYSGGLGFDSRPWRLSILIEVLWFFSVTLGEGRDSTLKLGHDHFVPNPFQFIIIDLSSYHRHYMVWILKKRHKINYQLCTRSLLQKTKHMYSIWSEFIAWLLDKETQCFVVEEKKRFYTD